MRARAVCSPWPKTALILPAPVKRPRAICGKGFATGAFARGRCAGADGRAPSGYVVHDTLTARLHPRRAGAALVAALAAQGVTVEQGDMPQGGTVIWATGYEGLSDLSRDLGRSIGGGVKGQSLLLAHAAPDCPQVFADGLHIVPHADGTVAIGSTSEREFDDPDTTDAQCDACTPARSPPVPNWPRRRWSRAGPGFARAPGPARR